MRQAHPFGLFCGLLMAALTLSCGARTSLRGGAPCPEEGELVACEGICGAGTTQCVGGFWTECAILPREETCRDVCGEGTRFCENEVWSDCHVDPVVEACDNNCGAGTRTCVERVWSECEVAPVSRGCTYGCGDGTETCVDDTWGACDATRPLPPVLVATVRDFSSSHPDFEPDVFGSSVDIGIVEDFLGADGKPVYAGGTGTLTTTGGANFDQWYRDVPGVNESTEVPLSLMPVGGESEFYIYEDRSFFPIDNQLLGNEFNAHNYHFTLEAVADFVYREGQVFSFDGDDDIWVFINRQLVIDIGGLHESLQKTVLLDDVAGEVGLVPGGQYQLHIFFAERHTIESNFVIETSITGLGACP